MRRIVDGKVYDTDKARAIATRTPSDVMGNHEWEETMYQTPNGSLFAVEADIGRGKYIVVLENEEEARKWLEGFEFTDHGACKMLGLVEA